MRIVAATRVLDEADIIEAFVRHTASFVSHHIFMDNGSNDGTVEILRKLAEEGLGITVFQNKSVHYNELSFNTFLYEQAVKTHSADWVLFVDADEFLDDRKLPAGLRAYLGSLRRFFRDPHCVKIPMVNYEYTRQDDYNEIVVPKRTTHRNAPTQNYKVIASGRIRGKAVAIANGSHDVLIDGTVTTSCVIENDLWLAHFSERHPLQIAAKFLKGWSKVLAAGSDVINSGSSYHYKSPYYALKDRPEDLLRSEWFMTRKNESPDLVHDPMNYKGGDLRYTQQIDRDMQVVRSLIGYMHDLAVQHGKLLDHDPTARRLVDEWSSTHEKII
jgi:glycosyltransferase involved in cell wall biosynthesis